MTGRSVSPMTRVAAYRGMVMAEKEKAVPTIMELLKSRNRTLKEAALKFIRSVDEQHV